MAAQIYRPPTPRTLPNSCSLGLLGLPLRKRLLAPMVGASNRIRAPKFSLIEFGANKIRGTKGRTRENRGNTL